MPVELQQRMLAATAQTRDDAGAVRELLVHLHVEADRAQVAGIGQRKGPLVPGRAGHGDEVIGRLQQPRGRYLRPDPLDRCLKVGHVYASRSSTSSSWRRLLAKVSNSTSASSRVIVSGGAMAIQSGSARRISPFCMARLPTRWPKRSAEIG